MQLLNPLIIIITDAALLFGTEGVGANRLSSYVHAPSHVAHTFRGLTEGQDENVATRSAKCCQSRNLIFDTTKDACLCFRHMNNYYTYSRNFRLRVICALHAYFMLPAVLDHQHA